MFLRRVEIAGKKSQYNDSKFFLQTIAKFKYLGATRKTNQHCTHEELNSRIDMGNACYDSV